MSAGRGDIPHGDALVCQQVGCRVVVAGPAPPGVAGASGCRISKVRPPFVKSNGIREKRFFVHFWATESGGVACGQWLSCTDNQYS